MILPARASRSLTLLVVGIAGCLATPPGKPAEDDGTSGAATGGSGGSSDTGGADATSGTAGKAGAPSKAGNTGGGAKATAGASNGGAAQGGGGAGSAGTANGGTPTKGGAAGTGSGGTAPQAGAGGKSTGGSAGSSAGTAGDGLDLCNPVNGIGCAKGQTCDAEGARAGLFACFPPPNTATLCQACDNAKGPFCAGGFHCLNGKCARYCCESGDCGTGTCDPNAFDGLAGSGVGVCVTAAKPASAACDANGPTIASVFQASCIKQRGTKPVKAPYQTCIANNECPSDHACIVGACRLNCAGQAGPIADCPAPLASVASGVNTTCVDQAALGGPATTRTYGVCALACTGTSKCPTGTTCVDGRCLGSTGY